MAESVEQVVSQKIMCKSVQVWQIPLKVSNRTSERYFACLAQDEKARANRFRFADDRRKFVVARGVLRHLLSRQLKRSPDTIKFGYGQYGKPFLIASPAAIADCGLHFNLSHSGEIALCALGYDRPVGVDLEKLKSMPRLDGMMARCFSLAEQDQIAAAKNPSRAFLQRWTCKEAYLKAIGCGLSQPMQTVEVQITPPQLTRIPHGTVAGWHLSLLALPDDYVGAVVFAGKAVIQSDHWVHP